MPVFSCARGCPRLISVSAIPGGSPVALADPEGYASSYLKCQCGKYTCDRCVQKAPQLSPQTPCPSCGGRMAWAGVPLSAAPAAAPRAAAPPAASPPAGGNPAALVDTIIGIGRAIDADLAGNNRPRAEALAKLAYTMMAAQGQAATAEQLPHLMRFGEQYFRWELFHGGCHYYRAIYQRLRALGQESSAMGSQAMTLAGSFDYLAGGMDDKPQLCQSVLRMASQTFGAQHPLTQRIQQREASRGQRPAAGGAFGSPSWDMTPAAAPKPQSQGSQAALRELSLWVTLAFLKVAASDGKLDDREYMVWKRAIANMKLPDLWDEFGPQKLMDMLKAGKLQELSVSLASLPRASKLSLADILKQVMLADGEIDAGEITAVSQVLSWLGLDLSDIGITIQRR